MKYTISNNELLLNIQEITKFQERIKFRLTIVIVVKLYGLTPAIG